MSIQSQAERIKANVAATYAAAAELGAEMPGAQNSDNLAGTVADAKAVLYTPQTLTDERKAQARKNIGFPSVTSADAGKFLRVSADGKIVAETMTRAEGVAF